MCLTISKEYHKTNKPLIAKTDLYVFKVCKWLSKNKKSCESYYQRKKQLIGKLLESELYSYSENKIEIGLYGLIIYNYKNEIMSHEFDFNWQSKSILLCKIPKGSKYFLGKEGDIVSNQMIIIEPIVCNSNATQLEFNTNSCRHVYDAIKLAEKVFLSYYDLPKYF